MSKELFASPLLSLEELEVIKRALVVLFITEAYDTEMQYPITQVLIDKMEQEIKDLKFEINRQS